MAKVRLDQLLVSRELAESRARAQALIMAGEVWRGTERLTKPGMQVPEDIAIEVRGGLKWVSRGGLKLEHALAYFALDVAGRVALDVGASTGGFTDVLLQHGARHVYAVDVGHGQLAWKLRNDPRVTVMERTNARHLTAEHFPELPEIVVCDASFISLRTVLAVPLTLTAPGATLAALIKPQFEVGKAQVGKGGIVRDPALHQAVCDDTVAWLTGVMGWEVLGLTTSPIEGADGNREFLVAARRTFPSNPA